MKRLTLFFTTLIFIAFVLTECKKDNNVNPQNPDTDNSGADGSDIGYNKADTIVSLQNGRITLDIPAGTMKEGTQVSIGSSSVKFVDTAHLLHQFELKPEGTTFKKPVTLTFHYDSAWLKGNSPWNVGIAYEDDKDGEWYPAVNGDVDTVKHTISIKTKHFSHWSIYTCFHLYMSADGQFSEDYSKTIVMQPGGDIGLLFMTMSEPPLWKQTPDKNDEFNHQSSLIAPLVQAPVNPKENDYKLITPDAWFVNGIKNGNDQVGSINLISQPHNKEIYEYVTPQKVPEDRDIAISALVKTVGHGWIYLIQGVQIVSAGYMPSGDIISESYNSSEASEFISSVTVNNYNDLTTSNVVTQVSSGGVTITTKAVDAYNGYVTRITSTPDISLMVKTYNTFRTEINKIPYVANVDTSFTVHPYKFSLPDGLEKGNAVDLDGDITTYVDYMIDPPGEGASHIHYVIKSYNRNGVIEGYDSLETKAGKFRCLVFSFDHVVADTNIINPGTAIKDETVFHTKEWLARGIGLVKTVSHDPTSNTNTIVILKDIERKQD